MDRRRGVAAVVDPDDRTLHGPEVAEERAAEGLASDGLAVLLGGDQIAAGLSYEILFCSRVEGGRAVWLSQHSHEEEPGRKSKGFDDPRVTTRWSVNNETCVTTRRHGDPRGFGEDHFQFVRESVVASLSRGPCIIDAE